MYKYFLLLISGTKVNDKGFRGHAENIIELQDMKLSPIASIRNKYSGKLNVSSEIDTSKFPPSFRISTPAGYCVNSRGAGLRYRGSKGKVCINVI